MKILGISAFFHDSAATLIVDDAIVAAAQEERFTRKKHDESFPLRAIEFVLTEGALRLSELDGIVFFEKPLPKFERLLETYVATVPYGFKSFKTSMPIWLGEKLFLRKRLIEMLEQNFGSFDSSRLFFSDHHLSHAASAFYASPFKEAVVLTIDGVGEWATGSVWLGNEQDLTPVKEMNFPHSLGLLYSAFTQYLGFKVNSGEYKVMGLAPYGTPKYQNVILENIIDVKADGSFFMDQAYFSYMTGLSMVSQRFIDLFGKPMRTNENSPLEQFHMDVAASIQKVTEYIMVKIARNLAGEYESKNLCLAGGVALNCVANSKIQLEGVFEKIFVQPCAGDGGGSLGAALAFKYLHCRKPRKISSPDGMQGSYLGPKFSDEEIVSSLMELGAHYKSLEQDIMLDLVAQYLRDGKTVGWFQGRMEFGPRALGARSILASPIKSDMQKTLNLKIKFRESFRPFAPAILEEKASQWFEIQSPSPYMLFTAQVRKEHLVVENDRAKALTGINLLNQIRSTIPAVTHVDNSARLQTVQKSTNPIFHKLITKFEELTGCPILVNTSFNVRGEPIVCSVEDAYRCFMGTELDVLAIGNQILMKADQKEPLSVEFKKTFAPD